MKETIKELILKKKLVIGVSVGLLLVVLILIGTIKQNENGSKNENLFNTQQQENRWSGKYAANHYMSWEANNSDDSLVRNEGPVRYEFEISSDLQSITCEVYAKKYSDWTSESPITMCREAKGSFISNPNDEEPLTGLALFEEGTKEGKVRVQWDNGTDTTWLFSSIVFSDSGKIRMKVGTKLSTSDFSGDSIEGYKEGTSNYEKEKSRWEKDLAKKPWYADTVMTGEDAPEPYTVYSTIPDNDGYSTITFMDSKVIYTIYDASNTAVTTTEGTATWENTYLFAVPSDHPKYNSVTWSDGRVTDLFSGNVRGFNPGEATTIVFRVNSKSQDVASSSKIPKNTMQFFSVNPPTKEYAKKMNEKEWSEAAD